MMRFILIILLVTLMQCTVQSNNHYEVKDANNIFLCLLNYTEKITHFKVVSVGKCNQEYLQISVRASQSCFTQSISVPMFAYLSPRPGCLKMEQNITKGLCPRVRR
jgi:hypothetical protein